MHALFWLQLYLNLVLEYMPETLYSISEKFALMDGAMPLIQVKVYMYQLSRALAHIHGLGICHRLVLVIGAMLHPIEVTYFCF